MTIGGINTTNTTKTYDSLGRVRTIATGTGPSSMQAASYDGDLIGNLTMPASSGIAPTYLTNSNKLTAINGINVPYDNAGNITNDGNRTYTYSPFNIPDSITQTITGPTNAGT